VDDHVAAKALAQGAGRIEAVPAVELRGCIDDAAPGIERAGDADGESIDGLALDRLVNASRDGFDDRVRTAGAGPGGAAGTAGTG